MRHHKNSSTGSPDCVGFRFEGLVVLVVAVPVVVLIAVAVAVVAQQHQ